VAAILRATMPLLPTPVITSLARRSAQPSSRLRAASTWALSRRVAAAAMAAASSRRQRVRADKWNVQALSVYTFSPKGKSKGCHVFAEKTDEKELFRSLSQAFFSQKRLSLGLRFCKPHALYANQLLCFTHVAIDNQCYE